jgi:hypothetical protein
MNPATITYIPTISLLTACSAKAFSPSLPVRPECVTQVPRSAQSTCCACAGEGQITGKAVRKFLLNSHDGTSSYQMLPGLFRAVCQNGGLCGESFGEVRCRTKEMSPGD